MTTPLSLTFSILIKCIICFDPSKLEPGLNVCEGALWDKNFRHQIPHDTKLRTIYRQHLVDVFRRADLRTYDVVHPESDDQDQAWSVAPDAALAVTDGVRDDGFVECDVEIKSPVFRFCPRALRRIEKVCRVLRKLDSFVDDSCAFWVRIGNCGKGKGGFPLQTLKHFCMLTALFEDQINSLHPPHRVVGNASAKPPSVLFRQGLGQGRGQNQNPWDWIAIIQRCKSLRDLVMLFAGSEKRLDREWAYDFVPLLIEGQGPPHRRTIEFRQHKGTLEWTEMMAWVQVAGGLVLAAHGTSADRMARFISTCAFDGKFTVFDLFGRLKLGALKRFYLGGRYAHLRTEPIWILEEEEEEEGPRTGKGLEWWEEVERRHQVERGQQLRRLDELDKRHEIERQRVLEKRNEESKGAGWEGTEKEAGILEM